MSRKIGFSLIGVLALAAAFALSGRLAFPVDYLRDGDISIDEIYRFGLMIWVPTGLSLAVLLLVGNRMWPGVALGSILLHFWIGGRWPSALGVAAGNTLEVLVASYALRKIDFQPSLQRLWDVVALLVFGALASTAIGTTVGACSLMFAGLLPVLRFGSIWKAWWWGHVCGDLIVTPVLLTWAATRFAQGKRRWFEAAAWAATLIAMTLFVFAKVRPAWAFEFQRVYTLFPLLIWGSLRFGPRGAAIGNAWISVLGIAGTAMGYGPFAAMTVPESVLGLSSFLAISATSSLVLAAVVSERFRERTLGDELRRANLQLARKTEQLLEAERLAKQGSFEWNLREDQVTWSEGFRRIFGLPAEAMPQDLSAYLERVYPEDRAEVRQILSRTREKGGSFVMEKRLVRPDGAVRYVQCYGKAQDDDTGRPARIIGMGRDVTERKQAEATRARLASIVESSEDAIIGKTPDGVVETWNAGAERLYGYSAPEVIGRSCEFLYPPERAHEMVSLLERIRGGQHVVDYETVRLRKDGSRVEVSVTVSPILDAAGRIVAVSTIYRDITASKRALREREVLLNEMHHRVKNNLQVVSSLLNLQAASLEGEARHFLLEAQQRVQSIALVHAQLHQARELGHVDALDYLRRLVDRLVAAYEPSPEAIRLTVDADSLQLDVDTAVPCGLIVNELVTNSLKHAFPPGHHGQISVALRHDEGEPFVLTVSDDGVGIPDQVDLEHLQSLGLQLVQTLTQQLHGTLRLFRHAGTSFRIAFPGSPRDVALPATPAAAEPTATGR